MPTGSFVLMLHSHLPFYRKAGMWPFGEENLYDAMAETYIPLLNALNNLRREGIAAHVTVGITPILAEQLADEYLKDGFVAYIESRLRAVGKDVAAPLDPAVPDAEHRAFLAQYYADWYAGILKDFSETYHRDLVTAFRDLQDAGCIEITTSGATHGFLPLLGTDESIEAQMKAGVASYKRCFGRAPRGIWLPECAYRPAKSTPDVATGEPVARPPIEAFLYENGLEYFFTEYHAIEGSKSAQARRDFGLYRNIQYIPLPQRPATGLTTTEAYWLKDYPVAVMGRNNRVSFQVWSAAHGYPGDGLYREFHKKDSQSGMKYWRLTGKDCALGDKVLYDPALAQAQAKRHALHFADLVEEVVLQARESSNEDPLVMVSFDTELYGHWWFEGVAWLEHVIRALHTKNAVAVETASEYLEHHPPKQAISLPESTWGQGGHYWVWHNQDTEWMWPVIYGAEARMRALVERFPNETNPVRRRVLNQALRELLLLQSSDWPFLVTTFQAKDYAVERFETHVAHFSRLAAIAESGAPDAADEALLITLEETDNPFREIDYRWFEPLRTAPDAGNQAAEPVPLPLTSV